jgi:hypothetical protein
MSSYGMNGYGTLAVAAQRKKMKALNILNRTKEMPSL